MTGKPRGVTSMGSSIIKQFSSVLVVATSQQQKKPEHSPWNALTIQLMSWPSSDTSGRARLTIMREWLKELSLPLLCTPLQLMLIICRTGQTARLPGLVSPQTCSTFFVPKSIRSMLCLLVSWERDSEIFSSDFMLWENYKSSGDILLGRQVMTWSQKINW